jgi:hypothetical protein
MTATSNHGQKLAFLVRGAVIVGDGMASRGDPVRVFETAPRQLLPGMAVGAGGALIEGVKRLPPVGLIDFSVGDTEGSEDDDGAVVVVVVVVVVDVSGAFSELPPHAAVRPTIATMAVPPA